MREILFRGKRKDNNEWIEGNLLINKDSFDNGMPAPYCEEYRTVTYLIQYQESYGGTVEKPIEVVPKTVGQYTGLTDKNGIEIFENDVVIFENMKCIIEYWQQAFRYKIINGDYLYCIGECLDKCEVIGNIHDNPELMKGKMKHNDE